MEKRPYLDKISSGAHFPLSKQSSYSNIHILPSLEHTGIFPTNVEPPPSVTLPDGSLNKSYIFHEHKKEIRNLTRNCISCNAIPKQFTIKSVKRINRVIFITF